MMTLTNCLSAQSATADRFKIRISLFFYISEVLKHFLTMQSMFFKDYPAACFVSRHSDERQMFIVRSPYF